MTVIDLLIRTLSSCTDSSWTSWVIVISTFGTMLLWVTLPVAILGVVFLIYGAIRTMKKESKIHIAKLDKIADELQRLSPDTTVEDK